jgi:manganese efflux pump family protein
MELVSQLLLALGLTADTFAVSVTIGLLVSHIRFWQATRIGATMALVQAALPLAGWLIGMQLRNLIADYDHWIAALLLAALGGHMIMEGLKDEGERKPFDPFKITVLISLAIATSIDAFVVGISLGLTDVNIWLTISMIGFLTYLVAMLGMLFGKMLGSVLSHKVEILGGIILIGIGIKTLFEHFGQ